jgi:hypothetical protein
VGFKTQQPSATLDYEELDLDGNHYDSDAAQASNGYASDDDDDERYLDCAIEACEGDDSPATDCANIELEHPFELVGDGATADGAITKEYANANVGTDRSRKAKTTAREQKTSNNSPPPPQHTNRSRKAKTKYCCKQSISTKLVPVRLF